MAHCHKCGAEVQEGVLLCAKCMPEDRAEANKLMEKYCRACAVGVMQREAREHEQERRGAEQDENLLRVMSVLISVLSITALLLALAVLTNEVLHIAEFTQPPMRTEWLILTAPLTAIVLALLLNKVWKFFCPRIIYVRYALIVVVCLALTLGYRQYRVEINGAVVAVIDGIQAKMEGQLERKKAVEHEPVETKGWDELQPTQVE